MNMNDDDLSKYGKNYSEEGLFDKVLKYAEDIGKELIFKAFQLWYVLQKPEVPMPVKTVIIGALGYFISPIDLIPDFTPVIGYCDDTGMIAGALLVAAMYIDDEVNEKAELQLKRIFG